MRTLGTMVAVLFALWLAHFIIPALGAVIVVIVFIFSMVTLIRWFEQTTEAVDRRAWSHVLTLLMFPFSVWIFPSRTSAGRPTAFPLHEPVRGFGSLPKSKPDVAPQLPADQPPPGTPKEFLEIPKPKPAKPRAGPDPELMAKLKEKMRQQGMLPPE